jgi:light-regulated signal transduction histidine kinase (bacteriophytochrome)
MTHTLTRHTSDLSSSDDQRSESHWKRDCEAELAEFVHDLRQPLSTIESLAYYLDLMCTDTKMQRHLRQIHEMVIEANHILERVSGQTAAAAVGGAI